MKFPQNAHQYHACPSNTKEMKRSSEIEQLNCFKNYNKSRIGKNVEFDCGKNLNNLQPRPKNEIKFALLNVPQVSKREYAGFYTVAFTYLILKVRIVSRCAINQPLLPDHLINFLEYSICSENIFTECKNFSGPSTYTSFTERLYCHCMQPDIGGTNERV